jgi:hypothetical protein
MFLFARVDQPTRTIKDSRPLGWGEPGCETGHLKKKRIAMEFGRIFFLSIFRGADKPYDTGAKYPRQPI